MKFSVLIGAALLLPAICNSQTAINFGIKQGFNFSRFAGKEAEVLSGDDHQKFLTGSGLSLTANTKVKDHFWIKHELGYWKKGGYIYIDDGVNAKYRTSQILRYFEILPASATYTFRGFQLYAGPYFGFLTESSAIRKNNTGEISRVFDKASHKHADFGIVAGVEYEFRVGLNIGARFYQGMSGIRQEDPKQISNQNATFTLGWTFHPRKGKSK